MEIYVNSSNVSFFKSLSSVTRLQIIEVLMDSSKNIGELAELLNISSAITTKHISMMEQAGIIRTENIPGKRGIQKVCSLAHNKVLLNFENESDKLLPFSHIISIPIGQYSDYEVHPTCGLVSSTGPIGVHDDPRYFSDPTHINATLLWFGSGWIEYRIPSYILSLPSLSAIEISLELCSEHPFFNENWPSDIYFYLNNFLLGIWICPGDFGSKRGLYTPDWWIQGKGTQYGLLKTIRITHKGTMLDGIHLSDTTLDQIGIHPGRDLLFRIASPIDTQHPGGVNIFGKGFGNYDQDIEIRIENNL